MVSIKVTIFIVIFILTLLIMDTQGATAKKQVSKSTTKQRNFKKFYSKTQMSKTCRLFCLKSRTGSYLFFKSCDKSRYPNICNICRNRFNCFRAGTVFLG